jgi:hypothetical protein
MLVNRISLISLYVYAVVSVFCLLPSVVLCQQANKPITKKNLISSLELGRIERIPAESYIKLIKLDGVDFPLTSDDEQEIRRSGRYLGKKGLDNLIAAVRDNYRPNVAQQPSPSSQFDQPTFREQTETVMFSFGENGVTTTFRLSDLQQSPQAPMFMNNVEIAHLSAEGNKLYVDAKIGDINAPVVEIKHNQFTSPPPNWDRNSNQQALEIVDENQIPVFQLYYKTPTHIVVNGIFEYRRNLYLVSNSGILMNPTNQEIVTRYLSKRIFKYPAWKYPGQYASMPGPSLINQESPMPHPLPVRRLSYSQGVVSSEREDAPYAMKVVIQTNVVLQPTSLVVKCDSEFAASKFTVLGALQLTGAGEGHVGDRTAYWLFFAGPAFIPENPVVIILMAKQPIRVLDVHEGPPLPR